MGGSTKSTQKSTTRADPRADAAYNSAMTQAGTVAQTPYNPATNRTVAGFAPDQLSAFAGINANAGNWQPALTQGMNMTQAGAGGITPEQIAGFMSPYQQQVIDATRAQMNDQNAIEQNQVRGNRVMNNALGGNRAGLALADTVKGQNLNMAQTISNLNNQGFNTALGAAQTDAARQLAGGAQMANMAGQQQGFSMNDIMAQLTSGNQQQQQQQNVNDTASGNAQQQTMWPYQNTQWLASILSGLGPLMGGTSSGSSTQKQNKGAGQMIGTGLSMMAMMSDERAKENIEHIGNAFNGEPIFKYNFKGDPRTQIGFIAQHVEKNHPEAVSERADGMKMVDYEKASEYASGGSVGGFGNTSSWFPWASVKPAQAQFPQLNMSSSTSPQQDPSADPRKMMQLGKDARGGFDNLMRQLDPAKGWGASIEPANSASGLGSSSGGFGGLGSLLSGISGLFAAGGGVDWGDAFPTIDPLTGRTREPRSNLIDDHVGEIGGRDMPAPVENELGGAPASPPPVDVNAASGGFGIGVDRNRTPATKAPPSAPEGGDMSEFWPDLFGPGKSSSGGFGNLPDIMPADVPPGLSGPMARPGENTLDMPASAPKPEAGGFAPAVENADAVPGMSARDFIKQQEGFTRRATWDKNNYRNGYGTNATGPGEVIDEAEANRRLDKEIAPIDKWLDKNITVPMTANQRGALTSFGFNGGIGFLEKLKNDINAGNWDRVAERMPTFNKARNDKTGELEPILTARRLREVALLKGEGSPVTGENAPSAGGRGPSRADGALVKTAVQKGMDPDAPVVSKPTSAKDKAAGGLLKRWFGVDFNPFKLDEDERMALLTAGLSMMSNGNVGSGGLAGMKYLTDKRAADRETDLNERKLALELYKTELGADKADKDTPEMKNFRMTKEDPAFADFLQNQQLMKNNASNSLPAEVAARIGLANGFIKDLPSIEGRINKWSRQDRVDLAFNRGEAADVWRRIETGADAMRRMLTGAGMGVKEAENYVQRYQIEANDSIPTMKRKMGLLRRDLENARDGALEGKTGMMGRAYRSGNAQPTPVREPSIEQKPAGMSDEEIVADAAAHLRAGATPEQRQAIVKRLQAWNLPVNGLVN
jgi:GH24 family phage-related lysozyme (muramidase)